MRGDRLRLMREQRDLSQEDLANRLDIKPLQIWRWETGKTKPNSETVMSLARALGVTSDYLLGLSDDPSSRFDEDELTAMEQRLIRALRLGLLIEAHEMMVELSKANDSEASP